MPHSLGYFSFSAPWIINNISLRIKVYGDFEYCVGLSRLIPAAGSEVHIEQSGSDFREALFDHKGIMVPGSVVELRWYLRNIA